MLFVSSFRNEAITQRIVRGSGGRSLAMISVSRKDLELIALQEIRSFPGGELVIAVEIECDEGYPNGMNWRLDVTAADNADIDRIEYAARTTTARLKRRYLFRRH
jgi:hypothetical protein